MKLDRDTGAPTTLQFRGEIVSAFRMETRQAWALTLGAFEGEVRPGDLAEIFSTEGLVTTLPIDAVEVEDHVGRRVAHLALVFRTRHTKLARTAGGEVRVRET